MRLLPVTLVGLMLLSGCSMFESGGVDYKSAKSRDTNTLEVPPDLVSPTGDNRYVMPDTGATTYSAYTKDQAENRNVPAADQGVLPAEKNVKLERAGSERWLVVNESPDKVWQVLKDFWQEQGFTLDIDSRQTGVMETDWAENRAKIPQDFIRNTIGKVFDDLYSTPYRDKFRTRIEKGTDGTEIYISHRGIQEVYTTEGRDQTKWEPRPADPGLEAIMLQRLMLRFGVDEAKAKAMLAAAPTQERARIVTNNGVPSLQMDDAFDRAWRRVGLALDRVGFAVEDRDRAKGVYYVRYIDPEVDSVSKKDEGWLSKLAFWKSSKKTSSPQLQIVVTESGEQSSVTVQGEKGGTVDAGTRDRILKLLHSELK